MRKCRKLILAAVVVYLLLGVNSMICDARYIIPSKEQQLTYEINENGEAVITGGAPYDGKLVIPETIDGYHVVGIADRAFAYRQDIHYLTINAGVRYIGAYAFAGCRKMNTPSLSEGLQAIGEGAFRDTLIRGDWEIRMGYKSKGFLPDSLMSIDKEAFACCSRLGDLELPPHADIASDAFEDTPWQEARDEVFQIRGSCLEYINNNTDPVLIIPYGVTELAQGDWMSGRPIMDEISRETVYEEIIFPDTIVKLGDSCLGSITIKRIEMPDSIKNIQYSAFRYGIVFEIVLSEKTEVIGQKAFLALTDLRQFIFRNP
ncbi:MAG: leucine-rich repeat protein [Lachnospiraceae bacterium]|nr:leucine-rich repeat protein [Lachnospiraceae bacterium]